MTPRFDEDRVLAALLICDMDENAALDRLLMTDRVPPTVVEEEAEAPAAEALSAGKVEAPTT